jgi:hypothetical protein
VRLQSSSEEIPADLNTIIQSGRTEAPASTIVGGLTMCSCGVHTQGYSVHNVHMYHGVVVCTQYTRTAGLTICSCGVQTEESVHNVYVYQGVLLN